MTKPPPTPCQRCRAELAQAHRLIDAMEKGGRDLERQKAQLDARLVAAVNKHDEERRQWNAERERLRGLLGMWLEDNMTYEALAKRTNDYLGKPDG